MQTPAPLVSPRDALDIVFASRNRAYGAYALRREYPVNLGKAMAIGLLLIGFFIVLPRILHAFADKMPEEKIFNVVAEPGPPPDIDPNNPPPPPPPPPPTPPPPIRTTIAYLPPVVLRDEEAPDERSKTPEEVLLTEGTVGTVDVVGEEGPPEIDTKEFEDVIVTQAAAPEEIMDGFNVNKMPSFPGGEQDLMKFLADHIEYPVMAKEAGIQGVVALGFVVGKDGSINDIQILKDIGGGCGKEALRVVKSMPKWTPGEANGHAVKVRFTLPVRFKLQ